MKNLNQQSFKGEPKPLEALDRFWAICQLMPGMVYQFKVDIDGTYSFTFISASVAKMLGIEPHELYENAASGFALVHPDDLKIVTKRAFFQADNLTQRSFVFRLKDRNTGIYKWIRANSTADRLADGSVIWNGIMIDVTLDKEAEQDRIAAIEEVNRELESFSYTVSHDLQTPLRSILGFSHILLTEHKEELRGEIREYLQVIQSNAKRMSDLTRHLLAFSRLGRAAIHYAEVDMDLQVQKVITELTADKAYRQVNIIKSRLGLAICDANLVKQVWLNVIGNAFKYSAKKELPVIEVGMQQGKDELIFFVKDNGAGFDMQYADKLFAPFQRIHSQEEFEGSGIGLATVHRIITKHGGRVWVEAMPGDGACFYFSLPVLKD